MTDYICRVCSVELGIKRTSKIWTALGTCPYCQERHVLYVVKAGELDWTPGIGSSDGFSRAINPEIKREYNQWS